MAVEIPVASLLEAVWELENAPEPSGHPAVVSVVQAARRFEEYPGKGEQHGSDQ